MTTRAMVDLETLSTRDDAAVIAIGVAIFDESSIIETQHWPLQFHGITGRIDGNTVAWWMAQSKEAQTATFGGERVSTQTAAAQFAELMGRFQVQAIWANGPSFDVTILKAWWERTQQTPWPFKYNMPRDYRTIVELAKNRGFTDAMYDAAKGMYVKHSAVDDAVAQARVVLACEKFLVPTSDWHVTPKGAWEPAGEPPTAESTRWRQG